jgi:hypothetical protein
MIRLTGCRFITPSAKLTFSVPWFERFVSWSVSVDSTADATAHRLSGNVTSGDPASLILPKGVLFAIQAQPAFLNDTTNAKLNRDGFLLSHLPCVPPDAKDTTEGLNVMGPDLTWNLTLELRVSPTLYETVRFMKQGPMELAITIFTTAMSVMAVWKTVFSFVEGPVSALRTRLTRRRQMPREQQLSGVELQPNDRMALLASVISHSKPDDSAALAAVKELRKEHQVVEDELHEKIKQQDLVIVQMTKKQDEVIRQLSLIQEQLKVAV